jgi:general secretion pathway protein G
MRQKSSSGFTMIELMIVVAIIGILAAIALPKFANMLETSREGATKGNASALKSADAIYYGDNPGIWPTTLNTSSIYRYSLYMEAIPAVKVTGKFDSSTLVIPKGMEVAMTTKEGVPSGQSTGWLYDSTLGRLYVNSTLRDSKMLPYSYYAYE